MKQIALLALLMFLLILQGLIPAFGEPLIVFESDRLGGKRGIYLLDLATGEEKRLSNGPVYDFQPSWSPDGQKIVFVSLRDGNWEIYVMDRDGRNQHNLTNNPGDQRTGVDWEPSWSPDGSQIAFTSFRDGNGEIYVMNPDGANLRKLTSSPVPRGSYQPTWSPDGSKIAFSSWKNGISIDIYIMNSDGSDVRNLTNHPSEDRYLAWSPDGQKMAFVSYRCCGDWPSLFVQEIESGKVKRIPVPFNSPQYPYWTPDRKKILFNANQRDSQLYIVDLETGEVKTLTRKLMPGYNGHPRWFESKFFSVTLKDMLYSTSWGSIKSQLLSTGK